MSHIPNSPIKNFPIVCISGSAGGLEAYIVFIQNLPDDMGVDIVIVNHITLMPTRLHEVLHRFTSMPVRLISECRIKEIGGTTIAQRIDTSIQPDMPKSAIATGWIDLSYPRNR